MWFCYGELFNLFWFVYYMVMIVVLIRLLVMFCFWYGKVEDFECGFCEFLLRGIGFNDVVIVLYLGYI